MTGETNQGMEVMDIAAGADTNATELPESLFAEDEAMPETRAEAEADAGAVKEDRGGDYPSVSRMADSSPDKGSLVEQSGTSGTPFTTGEDGSATESAPAQTLKIKFNGKEEDVSLDEAVILAQKGKNYDHVSEELSKLREFKSSLERGAKQSGVSVEQYIEQLNANRSATARASMVRNLEEQYPEASEGIIGELAELRMEKELRETAQADAESERIEKEARVKPWRDFFTAFPEVDAKNLPDTVMQEIQAGKSPVEAYQAHLIAELKRENQLAEQRGRNKALSVGSAVGDAAESEKDDFLTGFFG